VSKIITDKTVNKNTSLDNFQNPDKLGLVDFQESGLSCYVQLEPTEYAVSLVDKPSTKNNDRITYQNLLDSGLPLATFARACKVSNIYHWARDGVPVKYQTALLKAFQKHQFSKDLKQPSIPTPARSVEHRKNQKTSAFLGILPNLTPATNGAASSFSENQLVIKETGEIYTPSDDVRVGRYVRQSAARRILGGSRVAWCLRRVNDNELPAVLLDRATDKAHYGGLMSCCRVWDCPVCAAKISQRRRNELADVVAKHRANGGHLLLITYTFAHTQHDDLAIMMERLLKAFNAMKQQRSYSELKQSCGVIGTVRALEITNGQSGWHPHIHEIWFLEADSPALDYLKLLIFRVWESQCIKKSLGVPSFTHGVDVKDGTHASKYVSKWGIEDELTKSHAKKAKSGYSPFQLLDLYIHGDKATKEQAGALFAEYSGVFRGKRQLCWSRGLRKHFELLPELTDAQIALEQPESAYLLGKLELEQWAKVLQYRGNTTDSRAVLLGIAERGGWEAVLEYIEFL